MKKLHTLINRFSGKLTPSMKTCKCQYVSIHTINNCKFTIVTEVKQLKL
jgi:hypothetical protein